MKQSIFNTYKSEILSFADDMDDVTIVSQTGEIQFCKNNDIITCKLHDNERGDVSVEYNGKSYLYKEFLSQILGKLDVLAQKISNRDKEEDIYVDPDSILMSSTNTITGKAMDVLRKECTNDAFSTTKICFVTADAGHGKTMLLKTLERTIARDFINGKSPFLFWHIDLHGRDLVRLNEAIMYDLGELRISGIYYNSIITLIKNGLVVLAIDGFDELAAETGGDIALGSLTNLIVQLDGQGTIIAASRRTFFNTQEYLQRTKILTKLVKGCDFDELRLKNWGESECVEYMSYNYDTHTARTDYNRIVHALTNQNARKGGLHPLLERPFLFTKIVRYASENEELPSQFITQGGIIDDNIGSVIKAFVRREVTKWKTRDKETGKPYLSYEQHFELLSEIAREMWEEQKNYLSLETIEFILTILLEKWKIDDTLRPIICRFVQSHAMLPIAPEGDKYRTFDHEEFKNFFFAFAIVDFIKNNDSLNKYVAMRNILSKAQLPDTVAMYMVHDMNDGLRQELVTGLLCESEKEWRQTYFQLNLGTLIPFMLDEIQKPKDTHINSKVTFTSIVFENKTLSNLYFHGCNFINVSFNNTTLENITFDDCKFSNLKFYNNTNNTFNDVNILENCSISQVTINNSLCDASEYAEYSPYNIKHLIQKQGIHYGNENKIAMARNEQFRKSVKRFLNKYNSSSVQYEINIRNEKINNADIYKQLIDVIIPLLESYEIIRSIENNQTRQKNSQAWGLNVDLPELFKGEENPESKYYKFWKEIDEHE